MAIINHFRHCMMSSASEHDLASPLRVDAVEKPD